MTTEATKPWYIGERAEQTALLWLTEASSTGSSDRNLDEEVQSDKTVTVETNVVIEHGNEHVECDFRVTLSNRDEHACFFIDVKGSVDTRDWITDNGIFNSKRYTPALRSISRLNGPVAVVVVNVKSREGYFGWVVPPAGCSSVLSNDPAPMRLATDNLLSEIFDEVLPGFSARLTKTPSTRRGPR